MTTFFALVATHAPVQLINDLLSFAGPMLLHALVAWMGEAKEDTGSRDPALSHVAASADHSPVSVLPGLGIAAAMGATSAVRYLPELMAWMQECTLSLSDRSVPQVSYGSTGSWCLSHLS